jgi:hypothetical protein
MATRLKTVKYAFPTLASLTNNTLTNMTQITVYLPETGTKTFRSVVATVSMDDIITATGGTITTKTLGLRVGAAGYTSVANAAPLTNSGENNSIHWIQDFTSHFTTNWSGTSMTCDFQLQINQSTGTTLGMVNVCVTLDITYEYDDTSTTQVKTVMIPLNAPVGAIATAATTYDTMPALDTYLPEASKTYRNMHIVIQGNEARNAATTDHTMTLRAGAASVTTGNYEGALASDRFFRYVWDVTTAWPSTAATQTWQPTATIARVNHFQAWLVVTYEYNESTSTSIMNSVMLPLAVDSPMGGTTSSDYQRGTRELFIQEANVTGARIAYYVYWTSIAAIGGLNMRIGTGAFVAYTDTASTLCGTNAAMIRNDSAVTLAHGRNSLNFDVYRTDAVDYGWNVSGFYIVNYTSDKPADGSGAHNHTVEWGISQYGTAVPATLQTVAAMAPTIPEANYYMTAVGIRLTHISTTVPSGFIVQVERLSAEGGVAWEVVYQDQVSSDTEAGVYFAYAQMRSLFHRWPGDLGADRMNIETSRRWRILNFAVSGWNSLTMILTYHSITYTAADSITGFTGTVNLGLHRSSSGEKVLETTRSGDGAYSFTWYDDTEDLFVSADDGTNVGRSEDTLAV